MENILDIAKNFFGKGKDEVEEAKASAADGGNELFNMAQNVMENVSGEDKGILNVVKDLLAKFDIDVFEVLKDGKVEISELISFGKIFSKITGGK